MSDTAFGFILLGIGMLVVLGVVYVLASRGGPSREAPRPPTGVHLPSPSYLPVVFSVGAALIGAALAFRGPEQIANPFLAVPGVLALLIGIFAWVRAANHEWREVEHGSHDDRAAH